MDTDPESQDLIMITIGADYLQQKVGHDGVLRWYDPWYDIYESAADDTEHPLFKSVSKWIVAVNR